MSSYPTALVERMGFEEVRSLIYPHRTRREWRSNKRTAEEKILQYVEAHDRFNVAMCARCCVEKKAVVLSILSKIPNLQITPEGLCMKLSGTYCGHMQTKKGDR
jgi:hypothetical protein